jgi:predicted dehydrogenase
MGSNKIRVGIVGANPARWGGASHAAALQTLTTKYELVGVCTSRLESAQESARVFGAKYVFTDAVAMAQHPEIELVSIAVKVPLHAEIVRAVLDAGKHVYCEWPLARNAAEAASLLRAARVAGIHHAVGLQARLSPPLNVARALIAQGYVGRVASANVYSAGVAGAGGLFSRATAYALDPNNHATLLQIATAHTVDALEYLAGPISELSSIVATQQSLYKIEGTDDSVESVAPNQVLLSARMASGAVASVHVENGKVAGARTRIEVAGFAGDLMLSAEGARTGVQMADLRLRGIARRGDPWADIPAAPGDAPAAPEQAWSNVARLYSQLADDIVQGTRFAPDFADAVNLHELIEAITASNETGTRVRPVRQVAGRDS